ncbi:MAG TPA: amino acid--tRNA ligase-related protein [Verrucomicrobiae bacterium]
MEDTNSLIEQRRAKLKSLEAKGIFPFQNKFTPTEKCDDAREKYKRGEYNDTTEISVAGRITAHREMGKSMFIDVRDQSGRLQIYAQKNHLEETAPGSWDVFTHLDLGDFIGARGKLFTTKTGEISIKLDSFTIVAKSLRPPPAKWHGLEDTEIRYRQRYLDLIGNPDVKEVFLKRSAIVHEIRAFFHSRGYVEVETPAMQAIPGGAAAAPFKTHHNALGCEFYLRIALELYHKRLLVGGIDKLFEIGKNFRNEGLSRRHNPEFTMLEAYQAFGDYNTMMETVESLIKHVAQKVLGKLVIVQDRTAELSHALNVAKHFVQEKALAAYKEHINKTPSSEDITRFTEKVQHCLQQIIAAEKKIGQDSIRSIASEAHSALTDNLYAHIIQQGGLNLPGEQMVKIAEVFDRPRALFLPLINTEPKTINLTNWRRVKYNDLVEEKAGADWFTISAAERRQKAHDMGAEIGKEFEDFEVTNAVFSKFIEPTLINPTFVTHLPKELVPLAKLSPDDPTTVEVFECCINGQEISPGYTEQNDPIAQRTTLEHQAGGEQQKLDEDFLIALEHGMPPAGGIGIGIDRLCMMLLGQESIRDVILFPQLKPK